MEIITSAKTSRNQVPALHGWFIEHNTPSDTPVLDYGCGKYDTGMDFLRHYGFTVVGLDPYNRGFKENQVGVLCLNTGKPIVLVANVLNVIQKEEHRQEVISNASFGSIAYFTVHEGDKSGVGKETRDGYQMHRKADDYLGEIKDFFDVVERKGKIITAYNNP